MARELSPFESRLPVDDIGAGSDRSFGRVFAVVFVVIGLWPLIYGQWPRWWALVIAVAFAAVSIVAPHWLAMLNRIWFKIGKVLHKVVSPAIMGAIFFLVVTPIGVVRRWSGHDLLGLRLARDAKSYWVLRDPSGPEPESIKQQF